MKRKSKDHRSSCRLLWLAATCAAVLITCLLAGPSGVATYAQDNKATPQPTQQDSIDYQEVYRLAMGCMANLPVQKADAEDFAQQAAVDVMHKARSGKVVQTSEGAIAVVVKGKSGQEETMPLKVFVHTVARRAWIDHLRRAYRRHETHNENVVAQTTSADDPLEMLCARERSRLASAAIDELPKEQSDVIRLRMQGKKYKEIGECLGISLQAAQQRFERGRRLLAERLEILQDSRSPSDREPPPANGNGPRCP